MRKLLFSALAIALSTGFAGPQETPRQTAKRRLQEQKDADLAALDAAEAKRERRRLRNLENSQV